MESDTQSGPAHADVHAKALAINLDPSIYGTIAEIGAGQEVARWFLKVGGASGTIAQTISAYDKTYSDVTYGAGTRYVSEERLRAMLDHEYRLLVERLGPTRGAETRFFVFADTASARNYKGDNEQHAWIGLRFQPELRAEPSDIVLHVSLMDAAAQLQQEALGLLGVNLIHAAYYCRSSTDDFLAALWHELTIARLEVDVIHLSGPAFANVDSRAGCLRLIRRGMTRAIVLDASGRVVEPAAVLRKRPLIVSRSLHATVGQFHEATVAASMRELKAEGIAAGRDPVALVEVSLKPFLGDPPQDPEVLAGLKLVGKDSAVAVTDFGEPFLLANYLRRFTAEPIRFAWDVSQLARIFEERLHADLPAAILESLGKLFAANVKVHVYPMPREAVLAALGPSTDDFRLTASAAGVVTADDLHPRPPVEHLYRYLREAGWVLPLSETYDGPGAPTPPPTVP
jgi:hypothetical protein